LTEAYIGPAPTNDDLKLHQPKWFEVYEKPDGWFFNIPGDETKPIIKIGPYQDKDKAEFDSGEAEAC
jgi:hypothetical protein